MVWFSRLKRLSLVSLSSDVLLSHPDYHRGAACDCRCLTVALVAANIVLYIILIAVQMMIDPQKAIAFYVFTRLTTVETFATQTGIFALQPKSKS